MSEWMTIPEVAALVGRSRQQVWRYVRCGKLPSRRLGSIVAISTVNAMRLKQYLELVSEVKKNPFGARYGKS